MSTCPHASLLDLDNFASGTPREEIERLRSSGERLVWQTDEYANGGHWLVLQRDDIDTVLRTPADFTNNFGPLLEDFPEEALAIQQESMTFMDPPRHRQYRSLVDGAFRPNVMVDREPLIRSLAKAVIDDIIDQGRCEFVQDVALQTPMRTILSLLGVPESDFNRVADIVNTMTLANDPDYAASRDEGFDASMAAFAYGVELANDHLANPRDSLTMNLLNADVDGEQLSPDQYGGFFVNLIVGGMETTRNMSGWLIYEFIQHPEQFAMVQRDLSLIPNAIEEILRYRNTVVYLRRTATHDMAFAEKQVKKGDKVVCVLGSPNRDASYFDEPNRFDIMRDRELTRRNIRTFGGGPHFCLGMHQARLIMVALFEQIASRMTNLQLASEPLHYRSNFMDGFKKLEITFDAVEHQA